MMNNRDYMNMNSEELAMLGHSELRRLEAKVLDTLEHIEECFFEDECSKVVEKLNDLYIKIETALEIDYI